jgi:NACalpha-BTF3-like transcription factor
MLEFLLQPETLKLSVHALRPLLPTSDVLVVNHAWTYPDLKVINVLNSFLDFFLKPRTQVAKANLDAHPQLVVRMCRMMGIKPADATSTPSTPELAPTATENLDPKSFTAEDPVVDTVAAVANVSRGDALKALVSNHWELVNALASFHAKPSL